jgi:hypothetical protein
MRYVANVSWPRSGHHLLQRLLDIYFDGRFRYCEFYGPIDCCKSFPCTRQGVNMSKNHDFDLSSRLDPSVPLIVQYRRFVDAIASDFELHVRNGADDTENEFRRFAGHKATHYRTFVAKWTKEDSRSEKLVIEYETLVDRPGEVLSAAVRLVAPGEAVVEKDADRALSTVGQQKISQGSDAFHKNVGVQRPKDVRDFRYYDRDYFDELAAVARPD